MIVVGAARPDGTGGAEPALALVRDCLQGMVDDVCCRLRSWMRWSTVAYVARRTAEGLTKRDVIRCLKRYLAREIY